MPYVAIASVAYPADFMKKVERAINTPAPATSRCIPLLHGVGFESGEADGKLAVDTGLWVNYEIVNGKVEKVKKVRRKPVEEHFKTEALPPPLQARPAGRRSRRFRQLPMRTPNGSG